MNGNGYLRAFRLFSRGALLAGALLLAGLALKLLAADNHTVVGPMTLLLADADATPEGMVTIPEGEFTMGDAFNEGSNFELPRHQVFVSTFFMDRYEVTLAKWQDVHMWATNHGYDFWPNDPHSGKAINHPVSQNRAGYARCSWPCGWRRWPVGCG